MFAVSPTQNIEKKIIDYLMHDEEIWEKETDIGGKWQEECRLQIKLKRLQLNIYIYNL